jgi:CPA2 family monovalent cation:H+ antiporter-2
MHQTDILTHLLIILAASLPFALLFRALGQSTIVGYLFAGLVIGPGGLELIPAESIHLLAEVGVGLLLFEIGIELSLERLARMRRIALGGGALQVGITAAVTIVVVLALTKSLYEGVYLGCAIALSSSAIILKTLADRGDLDAPYTGAATGVAIFQDLATVPMMVVLPVLGAGGGFAAVAVPVAIAMGKAAALLVVLYVASRFLIDPLLYRVARARSPEVFVIAIMAIVLAAAAGSAAAGLSLALGAFIAGILLADSKYAHQILAEVTPFKGIFQATFFVSIGMLLDPVWVLRHPLIVAVTVAAVLVVKFAAAWAALGLVGVPARVGAATGILLSQVGEFSFVLIALGKSRGLIEDDAYQLVLAASFITMAVAPLLIANVRAIVDGLARLPVLSAVLAPETRALAESGKGHAQHVIICGYGPIGRDVAVFAGQHGMDYVAIELNPRTVQEHAGKGVPIFYGDFSNARVLEHAGIDRARALVVTAPDMAAGHRAVKLARALNPDLLIVARTRYQGQAEGLLRDGANEVIEEEFETAVEVVARLGHVFNISRRVCVEDMIEQHDAEAVAAADAETAAAELIKH